MPPPAASASVGPATWPSRDPAPSQGSPTLWASSWSSSSSKPPSKPSPPKSLSSISASTPPPSIPLTA
eukprot:7224345-Pyramimonas_sp.AAC.1